MQNYVIKQATFVEKSSPRVIADKDYRVHHLLVPKADVTGFALLLPSASPYEEKVAGLFASYRKFFSGRYASAETGQFMWHYFDSSNLRSHKELNPLLQKTAYEKHWLPALLEDTYTDDELLLSYLLYQQGAGGTLKKLVTTVVRPWMARWPAPPTDGAAFDLYVDIQRSAYGSEYASYLSATTPARYERLATPEVKVLVDAYKHIMAAGFASALPTDVPFLEWANTVVQVSPRYTPQWRLNEFLDLPLHHASFRKLLAEDLSPAQVKALLKKVPFSSSEEVAVALARTVLGLNSTAFKSKEGIYRYFDALVRAADYEVNALISSYYLQQLHSLEKNTVALKLLVDYQEENPDAQKEQLPHALELMGIPGQWCTPVKTSSLVLERLRGAGLTATEVIKIISDLIASREAVLTVREWGFFMERAEVYKTQPTAWWLPLVKRAS